MIKLFLRFIKNKYFIIWFILFMILLYGIFNPLVGYKSEYMDIKEINDNIYLFYVFLLPISFHEMGMITCFILETCYIAIVSYIVVNFINYFFINASSSTITRIGRKKWIYNVFLINLIFSIIVVIIYISLYIGMCIQNNIQIIFNLDNIIPILYKILLTIIIPNFYLLTYLVSKNEMISITYLIVFDILIQLLIKTTFNEELLIFNDKFLIILLLLTILMILYKVINNVFKRSDV